MRAIGKYYGWKTIGTVKNDKRHGKAGLKKKGADGRRDREGWKKYNDRVHIEMCILFKY